LFLFFCAFSLALSAALATASPAVPAASVTSNAAIAVCFAPEQDCAAFAVRAIDNAEREILVSAYGLTTGSGIVEALVRARKEVRKLGRLGVDLGAHRADFRDEALQICAIKRADLFQCKACTALSRFSTCRTKPTNIPGARP
jgi:hypothetical protein